jgi:ribonuclease inhibitor
MNVEIDGTRIASEADFHRELSSSLALPAYYGANLDALWDIMSTDVARPVHLVWRNSKLSQAAMPERFEAIAAVLRDVEKQDKDFGWSDRFTFSLE